MYGIRILTNFYINLGIAVTFFIFYLIFFSKFNKHKVFNKAGRRDWKKVSVGPTFIPDYRVGWKMSPNKLVDPNNTFKAGFTPKIDEHENMFIRQMLFTCKSI